MLISTFYYKFVLNQITTKMNEKKKRPDFLTVLCILSFIGIAFALYTNIRTILDPDAYILKIEQSQEMMEEMGSQEGFLATLSKMGEVHPKILENLSIFTAINLVLALMLLYGVIQMWLLKKTGFYVYTVAKILGFVLPLLIIGGNYQSGAAWMMGIFFAALFIFLYSLNLKAMN